LHVHITMNSYKFKASQDVFSLILTWVYLGGLSYLGYYFITLIINEEWSLVQITNIGIILTLLLVVAIICFLYSPQSYQITDKLVVIRPLKPKVFDFKEIDSVRVLDKSEMKGLMMTGANGGLFGYWGNFYNKTFRDMKFYATQRKNLILIKIKDGKKIVISPNDISMADKLKERIQVITVGQ